MSELVKSYTSESVLKRPGKLFGESISGLIRVRELMWLLFLRDLKAQYRESLMGYVWLVVPPVTVAAVWFFLNNQRIIRVETEIPYPLFVLIGTTIWTSFTSLVQQPLQGFHKGKPVFIKLDVPPEAFILSAVLRSIFELGVRVALVIPMFVFFKFVPPATAFLFPLALLTVILPALAIGVWLIPAGSLFGDVSNAVGSFVGLLMYTVPVVYPVPDGDGMLAQVLRYNPLTPGLSLCRDLLVNGSMAWAPSAILYSIISLLLVFVGFVAIRIAKPHLVERMGM